MIMVSEFASQDLQPYIRPILLNNKYLALRDTKGQFKDLFIPQNLRQQLYVHRQIVLVHSAEF